jgi:hypothetical protein
MRKGLMFKLVGASALLIGLALSTLLIGRSPALALGGSSPGAGPANQQKYCETYVHALASRLKRSVAELAAANKSALETTIQQAYTDGAITQSQETNMLDKVKQLGSDPCADLARLSASHHQMGEQYAGAHQAVVNAVAGALNLPPATLEQDLASGQTVLQIASAQHVDLSVVNAAYLAAVHTQLKTAVTKGKITQSQANAAYSAIQGAVAKGKYPWLYPHS